MSNVMFTKYTIGQFLLRYSICKPKMCNNENIALIIFLWEIDVDRNERIREELLREWEGVQIELDTKRFFNLLYVLLKLIPLSDVRQNSLFLMLVKHERWKRKEEMRSQRKDDVHFTCEDSIVHLNASFIKSY